MGNGNQTVCFCDNGPEGQAYAKAYRDVVNEENLTPISHVGAGRDVRTSSLDRELRDDFYNAVVLIVRLSGAEPLDNWAVPELGQSDEKSPVVRSGKKYLIYADGLSADALALVEAQLIGPVVRINGVADFSRRLKNDLRAALGRE
jgi:hypothetical protein